MRQSILHVSIGTTVFVLVVGFSAFNIMGPGDPSAGNREPLSVPTILTHGTLRTPGMQTPGCTADSPADDQAACSALREVRPAIPDALQFLFTEALFGGRREPGAATLTRYAVLAASLDD